VAFTEATKDDVVDGRRLGVEPICRVLRVALSTYYAARARRRHGAPNVMASSSRG
jgi:putative transposase